MASRRLIHAVGTAVLLLFAFVVASIVSSRAQEPQGNYGVGIPDVFVPKYLTYRKAQLASSTPNVLRVPLGNVKGLSKTFTNMVGELAVNLETGAYSINLRGLTPLTTYALWLVDRSGSDLIPTPDAVFRLTTVLAGGPTALVTGNLALSLPLGFTIDRVVVTPGSAWSGNALGAGTVNVFQKIFFRRLSLVNESTGALLFEETTPAPGLFAIVPDLAAETDALPAFADPTKNSLVQALAAFLVPPVRAAGGSVKLDKLISQGADLFFNKTFSGNGRTCGTCHPSSNNLTIDPAFIATLPDTDPLFVAEFNSVLAELERPALMRSFGLILENVDGLDDPTNKFVMRGVPHTLGLQVSLEPDPTQVPTPAEMTGWSGDGSPGTGSLREFAIGAVTQHFTKNLARVEGRDFELPNEHQLDAMEAFQLSLGRSADFVLTSINFTDPDVNTGKSLFLNGTGGGTCNFCHTNGGALSAVLQNQNRNFNTNVEDRVHPARTPSQPFPKDGGFGRTDNGDGTFGNRTFNTPPVVEAADTAPFFHNNVEGTIEDAVRFYNGPEFNNPRPPAARFTFTDPEQIDQIADFLRAINTLQNIDVARRELSEILAIQGNPQREQDTRLQTARDDTEDAIAVLTQGNLFPVAVTRLTEAQNLIASAQATSNPDERRLLVQQAIAKLDQARSAVAT
jgi:cytochrome c peroxidase